VFEGEAKKRQEAGRAKGGGDRRSPAAKGKTARSPTGDRPKQLATTDAAKAAGSTPRSVQRAKRVAQAAHGRALSASSAGETRSARAQ